MEQIKFPRIDDSGVVKALDQFAAALQQAGIAINAAVAAAFPFAVQKNSLEDYYLYHADPAEVVKYIVSQPQHTWNSVTIYPDEAWRYEGKSDWMWWRY